MLCLRGPKLGGSAVIELEFAEADAAAAQGASKGSAASTLPPLSKLRSGRGAGCPLLLVLQLETAADAMHSAVWKQLPRCAARVDKIHQRQRGPEKLEELLRGAVNK